MPGPASGIFISYRRDSTAAFAGRLYDRLSDKLGRDRVFIDIDTIEPGEDFIEVLDRKLAHAVALLVLIGRDWVSCKDAEGQVRLSNPDDFVRLEVASALKSKVRVIPVLVDGATVPLSQDLPPDLASLSRRQAIQIDHARFHQDAAKLIDICGKLLNASPTEFEQSGRQAEEEHRKAEAERAEKQRAEAERIEQASRAAEALRRAEAAAQAAKREEAEQTSFRQRTEESSWVPPNLAAQPAERSNKRIVAWVAGGLVIVAALIGLTKVERTKPDDTAKTPPAPVVVPVANPAPDPSPVAKSKDLPAAGTGVAHRGLCIGCQKTVGPKTTANAQVGVPGFAVETGAQNPKTPASPVRIGANVQQVRLLRQPKAIYPPLAKTARIQGIVKFQATIAKDGTIQNLELISGPPLLVQAAMDAVKRWQYAPTLMNGEPVAVITTVAVNFTLTD